MAIVKKCRHPRDEWDRCSCQWYLDHYVDGRRTYSPIHSPTDVRGIGSFAGVAHDWLDQYKDGRKSTYSTYRGIVERLCLIFDGWKPGEITGEVLDQFLEDVTQRFSPSYARQYHQVLVAVIQFAGLTVPTHKRPAGFRRKRRMPMTTTEIRSIIGALPPETQPMGEFAALTGMRLGELCGLRPIDRDRGGVWVRRQRQPGEVVGPPKSESGVRFVQLGKRANELLGDGEWCFPVSYRKAQDDLMRALKRAGLYEPGRGWHLFRHYNASLREQVGQGLRGAQSELGHSDTAQTLSYGWGEVSAEIAQSLEDDYFQA
jgi:integrase